MGHPQPIETGEVAELAFFKSTRRSAAACRVRPATDRRPQTGATAFDAFARKIEALKADQTHID